MSTGMSFFRWKKAVDDAVHDAANVSAASEPAPVTQPDVLPGHSAEKVNPWTGLTDAIIGGWFNNQTGELFTGFQVSASDIVADIGCGDGGNAAFCAKFGARVILADIDPDCIAAAAARLDQDPGRARYESHVTDSDPLPITTGSCTRIVCTEVIEHVPSPDKLMSELARIGQSGARYLITCPDPAVENLYKKIAHPSYFEPPNHVRILSHDDLDRCVQNAGLIIESRASYGFYWAMWWALFWACDASIDVPTHPILDNWSRTWQGLLDRPDGPKIRNALDAMMPKSQILIARKG